MQNFSTLMKWYLGLSLKLGAFHKNNIDWETDKFSFCSSFAVTFDVSLYLLALVGGKKGQLSLSVKEFEITFLTWMFYITWSDNVPFYFYAVPTMS